MIPLLVDNLILKMGVFYRDEFELFFRNKNPLIQNLSPSKPETVLSSEPEPTPAWYQNYTIEIF